MKLVVVLPCLNQFSITRQAIQYLLEAREQENDYSIIVLDHGSDVEFEIDAPGVEIYRTDDPVGSYPVFKEALGLTDADILAFFHTDTFIYEKGWDKRVMAEFEKDPRLALIGFIGSNEIDSAGGRGLGTTSNFQGRRTLKNLVLEQGQRDYEYWSGSPAEVHGKRNNGFAKAAVVDGCSMILRRVALEEIGFREGFPPHHHYDRLISCQLLEKKWNIGVLGIEFDHISGQVANQEQKYHDLAKKWILDHKIRPEAIGVNWDLEVYLEAERQFLREYRDQKHLIPVKV